MNFIIYLLDSLTPLALKNSRNKYFYNEKLNSNYLSVLQAKSLNFYNSYGYGETFSTTYEIFTGQDIQISNYDAFDSVSSLNYGNSNLASFFKKKKFNTILFRDPKPEHATGGFYKKYFDQISRNFDEICLIRKSKNYNFDKFYYEYNIKKYLNKNNFFFFHDFSLHDNPKAYFNPTAKSYLKAVDKSSKIVKHNLELIQYKHTEDILVFLSDHGLNLSPSSQMHSTKKINVNKYELFYKNLFTDEKIKTTFFVRYPNCKRKYIDTFVKPKQIYNFVYRFYKINFNLKKIKNIILNKNIINENFIITSVKAAFQDPYNNSFLKNWFHCHVIFLSRDQKIAYSHKHNPPYYDLIKKKHIDDSGVNIIFKNYIKKYFSRKQFIKKYFKFILFSYLYRKIKNFIKFFYKFLADLVK